MYKHAAKIAKWQELRSPPPYLLHAPFCVYMYVNSVQTGYSLHDEIKLPCTPTLMAPGVTYLAIISL